MIIDGDRVTWLGEHIEIFVLLWLTHSRLQSINISQTQQNAYTKFHNNFLSLTYEIRNSLQEQVAVNPKKMFSKIKINKIKYNLNKDRDQRVWILITNKKNIGSWISSWVSFWILSCHMVACINFKLFNSYVITLIQWGVLCCTTCLTLSCSSS